MPDDDDELAIEIVNTAAGSITPFFGTDVNTGMPALGIRLDARDGIEWPWGGRAPVVIALSRGEMGEFLGHLTDVAQRVYSAVRDGTD